MSYEDLVRETREMAVAAKALRVRVLEAARNESLGVARGAWKKADEAARKMSHTLNEVAASVSRANEATELAAASESVEYCIAVDLVKAWAKIATKSRRLNRETDAAERAVEVAVAASKEAKVASDIWQLK